MAISTNTTGSTDRLCAMRRSVRLRLTDEQVDLWEALLFVNGGNRSQAVDELFDLALCDNTYDNVEDCLMLRRLRDARRLTGPAAERNARPNTSAEPAAQDQRSA